MSANTVALKRYRLPQFAIGRFIARRTMRSAVFWALIFGATVASKAAGYAAAVPTAADRAKLAASFGNNIGLTAMLGAPNHIDTVTGYTVWNTLSVMVIIGSIWALLTATKTLRGEEDAGRWELLLAGPTTARRAAINALAGLGMAIAALYIVVAISFILIGKIHTVSFGGSAALFFALSAVAGAAEFMAIGALMSQIMPTRSRAASATAVIFGLCFLVRATGDISSAHWLLSISPLGWIEKLQPLYGNQPLWLLPIGALILASCILTVLLASARDLGGSTIPDSDTAQPHTLLLNSPFTIAIRLTRTASLSWLAAVSFVSLFFGALTKSAAQAFNSSPNVAHVLSRLAQSTQSNVTLLATKTYLGIVFFFMMLIIMAYVASALGSLREDEAQGYIDNLVVRRVSRLRLLCERSAIILGVVGLSMLLGSVAVWIGEQSQQGSVGFSELLQSGMNAAAPALFVMGIGILALGFLPRLTSLMAYGVLAWSFLIQIISSGINLNHWIVDTSVLHHVSLAPATDPNWRADITLIFISAVMAAFGAWRFMRRDLESE